MVRRSELSEVLLDESPSDTLVQQGLRHLGIQEAHASDSTITPPETGDFFNEDFMATRHEEGCYDKAIFIYLVVCKAL